MNAMTKNDFVPKVEMYVYSVECSYTTNNSETKQFCFKHITPEPIETQYGYILNIVCNNMGIAFKTLCSGYFDLQIFRVSTVSF